MNGRGTSGGDESHRGTPYQHRDTGEWGARVVGTGDSVQPGHLVTVRSRKGRMWVERVTAVVKRFGDGNALVETGPAGGVDPEDGAGGGAGRPARHHAGSPARLAGGGPGARIAAGGAEVGAGDLVRVEWRDGRVRYAVVSRVVSVFGGGGAVVALEDAGAADAAAAEAAEPPPCRSAEPVADGHPAAPAAAGRPVEPLAPGGAGAESGGRVRDEFDDLPF